MGSMRNAWWWWACLLCGGACASDDLLYRWWALADVPEADVRALHGAGLDERCVDALRKRLPGDLTKPLDTLTDATAAYDAFTRAMELTDREGARRCVLGQGDCTWALAPVRRACGRAPDAALFDRVLAPPRAAWWALRAFSAFFLPPPPVRRRLGLLDGDGRSSPSSNHGALPSMDAFMAQATSALQALAESMQLPPPSSSSTTSSPFAALQALFPASKGHRRLGLWAPGGGGAPDATALTKLRAFVRAVPTLRTDAQRAAAERALTDAQRALTKFATDVYLELPPDKKMLVAAIARKDEAALHKLLAYLKATGLARSVRTRLGFTRAEAADALAYAGGDDARFDRVAAAYAQRVASAPAERAAVVEMLRYSAPATRALGVAVAWLQAQ